MKLRGILALVTAAAFGLAVSAHAQSLTLPPQYTGQTLSLGTLSDQMVVFANGGAGGAWFISETPGDEGPLVLYEIDHNAANQAAIPPGPVVLLDPDGSWSDIIGVTTDHKLGFVSDSDGPGALPLQLAIGDFIGGPVRYFIEPNYAIDLGALGLLNPGASATGYFQSDGEVPDGGLTVALLGSALVGLEGLRRRFGK